jgi:8-oxo-dGTP diphosphatase
MQAFNGVKAALIYDGKLVMYLRDNKPGLRFANLWDFPGGGREGEETPLECLVREVLEEFSITLNPSSILWQREYPAMHDPAQRAWFFVVSITQKELDAILFGSEGQRWAMVPIEDFFVRDDVVPDLKGRLQDYLDERLC